MATNLLIQMLIFIVTILFPGIRRVEADIKTWTADTNFNNPRLWDKGILPCPNDRVIFPSSAAVLTFMPSKFTFAELILPIDGGLIFPEDVEIVLTEGEEYGACKAKDVYFKTPVDYWYNSSNWNITSPNVFPGLPSRKNLAVPHGFRVPCHTDRVHFPMGTTFKVHIDFSPTSVAYIQVNGINYVSETFEGLLKSPTGKLLFPNNPELQLTGAECTDPTGCYCGNVHPKVMSHICSHHAVCPEIECSDSIAVIGHCCKICGVILLLNYNTGFEISKLMELNRRYLEKPKFRHVESFTAKIREGLIQTVFIDSEIEKGFANEVSQLIHDAILRDISGPATYKVRSLEMSKSEAWGHQVPGQFYSSGGVTSGGAAAIIIFIIAVIGIAAAVYIYRRRYIPGFSFARFDLHSEKIELELGTTPHDELQPGDTPEAMRTIVEDEKAEAFDNPAYGSCDLPVVLESSQEENIIENPMFGIFEDATSHEKS